MKNEIITLEKFTYGGDVFGRLEDQRAVFVPFAFPGERVHIHLVEEKKRYARGELIEIITPSPERIKPRCRHFTRCGGCHYQHLPYQAQLKVKSEILKDQLQRIGKIDSPPLQPIIASPNEWYYRNHIQFHLTPEGRLGYQAQRSHDIIPIEECHLPELPISEIWSRLQVDAIPGLDRVGIRVGAEQEVLLNLESSDPQPVSLELDLPISVVHIGPVGSLILAGDDYLTYEIKGHVFKVSAGSFFQVNTPMADAMVDHILKHLSISPDATLLEAYCGVGLFSAFLAPRVRQLVGIEASPSACDDFVTNLDTFDNVTLYEAAVEDVLQNLQEKTDVILIDPPRNGLDRKVVDGILSLKPKQLVYVSCDPATLARDLQRLIHGGYTLTQITPFDLFPQTYHIESISFLQSQGTSMES